MEWYLDKTSRIPFPIYSSYDIRDAGFKVANVDANIFPAGFNNICSADKEYAVEVLASYINKHYGSGIQRIMLVTEEHTNNPYYWENVNAIRSMLEDSGRKVLIALPRDSKQTIKVQSVSGVEFEVGSAYNDAPAVKAFRPQLIISNNDFSESYDEWAVQVREPMNPPRELGWYQRKKSLYFEYYNKMVREFAELGGLDPFQLSVRTEKFEGFDLEKDETVKVLAFRVDKFIKELQDEYKSRGIDHRPNVFIKNNSGTYGLAVIQVGSGEDVLQWNYKSRKKMKAAKGGKEIEDVILQEGILSRVQADGAVAEPVIYMVGNQPIGGFLRSHPEKSNIDSLNSPGAVYKRICVSDLNVALEGSPLANVYAWSSRLGLLAIGLEAQAMNVEFKGFRTGGEEPLRV
ncbi:MAG: glutamate--cysteine ligase [Bdellovibrio sp.]|nr:MAG: glutamate--cysteine ligase [Bdellovibrio sp.]